MTLKWLSNTEEGKWGNEMIMMPVFSIWLNNNGNVEFMRVEKGQNLRYLTTAHLTVYIRGNRVWSKLNSSEDLYIIQRGLRWHISVTLGFVQLNIYNKMSLITKNMWFRS
jgi:hypothetical protein